jgi:hypothetical protein
MKAASVRKKALSKKRKKKAYTKGEINKLIDSLIHPLTKTDKRFVLVDGLLHGVIEQNPPQSVKKFVKYNLPELIRQLEKSARNQT